MRNSLLLEARGEHLAGKITRYFIRKIKNKDWEEIYRPLEEYNDGKSMPCKWIEYKDDEILCNLFIFPEKYFEKQNDELIDIYGFYFSEDGYLPTQKHGSIEVIVELDELTKDKIEFFVKRLKTVLIHEINHKYQEEQGLEYNEYELESISLESIKLYNFLLQNIERVDDEDIEHFSYHLNENEVDSVVRELYAQAKRDKQPYISVLRDYIRTLYGYDKNYIQENNKKDIFWVFYKELYKNMIKHAKRFLPKAQMDIEKVIKEEVKKSIKEARMYNWMYAKKRKLSDPSTWFFKPIDFKDKYEDFNEFLAEKGDKIIDTSDFTTEVMSIMPAQLRHIFYQNRKNKYNKKSIQEIYNKYKHLVEKPTAKDPRDRHGDDANIRQYQFILEKEYEKWKGTSWIG